MWKRRHPWLPQLEGRGVPDVISTGRRRPVRSFSACRFAVAGSEAERITAASAFTRLSARVRVSQGWQTIWETSGGRTSRQPPAAQVHFGRLPGSSHQPPCPLWQSRWSAGRWGAELREHQAGWEQGVGQLATGEARVTKSSAASLEGLLPGL